jgi:hypothetical protein
VNRNRSVAIGVLAPDESEPDHVCDGDLKKALQVLKRAGKGNPPVPGDELPAKMPRRRR